MVFFNSFDWLKLQPQVSHPHFTPTGRNWLNRLLSLSGPDTQLDSWINVCTGFSIILEILKKRFDCLYTKLHPAAWVTDWIPTRWSTFREILYFAVAFWDRSHFYPYTQQVQPIEGAARWTLSLSQRHGGGGTLKFERWHRLLKQPRLRLWQTSSDPNPLEEMWDYALWFI